MFPTTITTSNEFLNSFSQQDLTNILMMPGLFANSNASQFLQKQFEEQIANNNQNLAENSSLVSSSPQMVKNNFFKLIILKLIFFLILE